MEGNDITINMIVRTHKNLSDNFAGVNIHYNHLHSRRADAIGKVLGYVAGLGGDWWWVLHRVEPFTGYDLDLRGPVAAYLRDEFEEVNLHQKIKALAPKDGCYSPKRLLYDSVGRPCGNTRRDRKRWLRELQIKQLQATMFLPPVTRVAEPFFVRGDEVFIETALQAQAKRLRTAALKRGVIEIVYPPGPRGQIYWVRWEDGIETPAHQDDLMCVMSNAYRRRVRASTTQTN